MKNDCQMSFITHQSARAAYHKAAKSAGMSTAMWVRKHLALATVSQLKKELASGIREGDQETWDLVALLMLEAKQ